MARGKRMTSAPPRPDICQEITGPASFAQPGRKRPPTPLHTGHRLSRTADDSELFPPSLPAQSRGFFFLWDLICFPLRLPRFCVREQRDVLPPRDSPSAEPWPFLCCEVFGFAGWLPFVSPAHPTACWLRKGKTLSDGCSATQEPNQVYICINICRVGVRRTGPGSVQWCPATGQGATGTN